VRPARGPGTLGPGAHTRAQEASMLWISNGCTETTRAEQRARDQRNTWRMALVIWLALVAQALLQVLGLTLIWEAVD